MLYAGLGNDRHDIIQNSIPSLEERGFTPHRRTVGWNRNIPVQELVQEEFLFIKEHINPDDLISLVGTSAGGVLALLTDLEMRDRIHRVICVSSRLQEFPWYALGKYSPNRSSLFDNAFRELDKRRNEFAAEDGQKIMTVRGKIDEVVPPQSTIFEYAQNVQILHWYAIGHMHIIRQTLQNPDFAPEMWEFLKKE